MPLLKRVHALKQDGQQCGTQAYRGLRMWVKQSREAMYVCVTMYVAGEKPGGIRGDSPETLVMPYHYMGQ